MIEVHQAPPYSRRCVPWVRIVLALIYIALGVSLVAYEGNAHRILAKGGEAERSQRYQTAGLAYMMVIERFSFSFAVVEAKTGIHRIGPAIHGNSLPEKLGVSWTEKTWGDEFDPYLMDWLPFFTSFGCGVLLIPVFLTRIRRGWIAAVTFLLICLSASLAVVQLSRYGWLEEPEIVKVADAIFAERLVLYIGSYALVGMTVLLTLTRTCLKDENDAVILSSQVASTGIHSSVTARLQRLQELHNHGLILDSEMQKRRQEILSEL